MKASKIFKTILIFLFLIFIALFISQANGYYEYQEYKKVALTNEQIKEFEEDLKAGKKIDVKDYVGNTKKDYGNKVSNIGLTISKKIESITKSTINKAFGILANLVDS